jgi:aminomethyltransferase
VQGPQARDTVATLLGDGNGKTVAKLGRFAAAALEGTAFGDLFVARTGYTGEDGFEIVVGESHAVALWTALHEAGVAPAGLGARDTLRLEAGLALYGQDMDETVSPFEAALGWTVALDEGRAFNGRALLESQADGAPRQMIGLVMDDKGVLRHGQTVATANGAGEILSGTFSPTIGKAIAFARVPAGEPGEVTVDIRGRQVPVRVVKFPFVKNGQPADGV